MKRYIYVRVRFLFLIFTFCSSWRSFENLNIFYDEEKGQEMQSFLRGVREEGEDRV